MCHKVDLVDRMRRALAEDVVERKKADEAVDTLAFAPVELVVVSIVAYRIASDAMRVSSPSHADGPL